MSRVDDWFARERGITSDTLDAWGVRRDDNSATFPYSNGQKTRTGFDGGERGFKFTAGVAPALFTEPAADYTGVKVAFLCEGESDTMRLWQELNGGAVFGLAGVNTWRDEFRDVLAGFDTVFVVLDNESEYDNPRAYDAVEACWADIRASIGLKRAQRIKLPMGTKDLCEFFNDYDLDMLRLLAQQKASGTSRFRPLDLNVEPPPVEWVLDGLVAKGDMTLLSGASGLGKSWFTMGLAVAIADNHETFLNLAVPQHGRVLYFDEENPRDVVFHRLKQLGLKNKGNLRYLWNNGVRVDRHPEVLLEEAIEYDPVLIVLDSLTRIHGKEENLAGDMAPLLNEAIRPLARESGAAVVIIHHHDKAGNGPRGSGDITASMDGALDIFGNGVPGQFTVKLSKSRRRLAGKDFHVKIEDLEGGQSRLIATSQLDSPF